MKSTLNRTLNMKPMPSMEEGELQNLWKDSPIKVLHQGLKTKSFDYSENRGNLNDLYCFTYYCAVLYECYDFLRMNVYVWKKKKRN